MDLLSVSNIEVVYKGVIRVIKGVSLKIPQNSMVSLIGANGSGKSTVLKAISGFLKPDEGEMTKGIIRFCKTKVNHLAAEKRMRLGMVHVMQGHLVFEHLTVGENLLMGAHIRNDHREIKQDMERLFDLIPLLREKENCISGYLSGGEQQILVLARAILSRPSLLLLDEPLMGLSPALKEEICDIIQTLCKKEGVAVLLAEQNSLKALELSDYGYVLENGRVVADGASDQLMKDPDIKEFYLGLSGFNKRKHYRDIKHYKRRKRWL